MTEKVFAYIRQLHMIQPEDQVYVALSGGADSVALLLLLKELQTSLSFQLQALHVEHGIRGQESLDDQNFCQELCKILGIPLQIFAVDAPAKARQTGMSLEEAARKLRYDCLYQAAGQKGKIALAHHRDDQCETLLFHLVRGTGVDGMAGMHPIRGQLIRPFLCVSREEVEDYLRNHKQDFCQDQTNLDLAYSRNKIRHEIMPVLREVNANAEEHMARFAEEMEELSAYLGKQVEEAKMRLVDLSVAGRWAIDIPGLLEEEPVIARRLLLEGICQLAGARKDITSQHVLALIELCKGQSGRQVDLPYQIRARRSFDLLLLEPGTEVRPAVGQEAEREDEILVSPGILEFGGKQYEIQVFDFDGDLSKIPQKLYTKWLDYDKIKFTLCLRYRRSGDYLQVTESGGRKKLKSYLIEEKVPADMRKELALLADDNHIVWVVGYRISEGYKVTENTKKILEIKCYEGNHS